MSSLTIALIQTDIHWLSTEQNLSALDSKITDAGQVDLIVLPETFATGFAFDSGKIGEPEGGPILQWMLQKAAQTGAVIAGSVAVKVDDKLANRLYWVSPNGDVDFYDKRHLFRMGNEQEFVVAGQQRRVFELKGLRILPNVCYDLRFPVWSRNRNDYDVMLNVANWPAARRHPWDTLLKARAMENQCYVIANNRIGEDGKGVAHSGGTVAVDFKGEVMAAAADNCAEIITCELSLDALQQFKTQFPAYLDGDAFSLEDLS